MKSSRIISAHEALNTGKKVDYVVPFPYCSNIEVDPAGQLRPSLQSEGLSEHPELNTDSTIYEALDYHADRVEAALNAHGVEGDIVVIEDVLHEIGIHDYDRFAPVIDGLRRSERIVRALTWLPGTQKGLIPNLIMKRSGPRVVDVIENDDGTLGLENVTSRKKAARLEKQIVAARQTKTT
jgi:hypothetical protein